MPNQMVDPHVRKLWDQLEDEEQGIVMERRRLQDIWKKISAMHKANQEARQAFEKEASFDFLPPSERILLNVGGHLFETTAGVLCRDRYSLLSGLCKSTPLIAKGDDGVFFLDRDWWIFRFILQFLRSGNLPFDNMLLREMYEEASFYRLNSLRRAIEKRRPVLETNTAAQSMRAEHFRPPPPPQDVPLGGWDFMRCPSPIRAGRPTTAPPLEPLEDQV